ncbi:MAG: NAD(P)H-hydrate dehydratase [Clostridiales bacterium]|jgi:NAD(P)H-hydrate epimerase|nr:NAD(P)H-hydrate dehydratase [Clostridiales bacterium]
MNAVTSERMYEIERIAIEKYGIPSIILMENAAVNIAAICARALKKSGVSEPKVIIAAGTGNNGGDGTAIARHLLRRGINARVMLIGDMLKVKGDALLNLEIARKFGIVENVTEPDERVRREIASSDLIVDALFGIGMREKARGAYEYMIKAINDRAGKTLSVDMPSGVNADTGQVTGAAVRADITAACGFMKLGLALYPGAEYAGDVEVVDVAIPPQATTNMNLTKIIQDEDAANILPRRVARSHKGSHGHVHVFAGCDEMPGAAVLTCMGAYRAGCGKVTAYVTRTVAGVINACAPEVITRIVSGKDGRYCRESYESSVVQAALAAADEGDVIVMGPGIGRSDDVSDFVFGLLEKTSAPIILDADALYAIAKNKAALYGKNIAVTPHFGEMSRLTALSTGEISENTMAVAKNFAEEFGVTTLLKDSRSIIAAPSAETYINVSGNSALAKAGAGDALSGLIAGFAAQGLRLSEAAALGAYIHGRAGESASKELSLFGVNASDVLRHVPIVMNRLAP